MSYFVGKRLKFYLDFKSAKIKIEIKFLVSEIIPSELVSLNNLYYEGNTCHEQSMR